ncbi:AAA family ATPase [Celeribacter ethanolicus]|uniref:AAA family ATPase n=1 Tax=Celeribacter ethanolicus TaxID=1758178 RepID=UPI0009D6E1E4|nr:AAA family ATPase [Celeribacter ethanolicus]
MKTSNKNKTQDPIELPIYKGSVAIPANSFTPNSYRPYIVKDLLLARQVSMVAGESNLGKSAIVAGLAAHVAMGRDFGGMKVVRTAVLYVAAEDPEGVLERAYPYMSDAPDGAAIFSVLGEVPDMTDPREFSAFKDYVEQFVAHHDVERLLIVFDTFSLSIGDAEENHTPSMTKVIRHAHQLARSTGAHVLFVHHVGIGDKSRGRGSSAITASVDTLLMLEKAQDETGEVVMLHQRKQRRVRKGKPLAFRVKAFQAGIDQDGDVFTVPMAVPLSEDATLAVRKTQSTKRSEKPSASSARAAEVLGLLKKMAEKDPQKWHSRQRLGELVGGPFNEVRSNNDTLRKAVSRAVETLLKSGGIEQGICGGYRYVDPFAVIEENGEGEIPTLH